MVNQKYSEIENLWIFIVCMDIFFMSSSFLYDNIDGILLIIIAGW